MPSWSPDGRRIAFGSDQDGNYEIYDERRWQWRARLTDDPANDLDPAWSPDATGSPSAPTGTRWEIYVMSADGLGPVSLTNSLAWSSARPGPGRETDRLLVGPMAARTSSWTPMA